MKILRCLIKASAGSHIATKSIKHVLEFDENTINEKDMSGLKLYDGILICHYDSNRREYYNKLIAENEKVETLTDDEIMYLNDNEWIKE